MTEAYLRPTALREALDVLAARRHVVLAGGTDFYPMRVGQQLDQAVVDITKVSELQCLRQVGQGLRIGATSTWRAVRDSNLPPAFGALQLAAREVGGAQIQNAGTVGGNLCNASPAADGVPALLALDAMVELRCSAGVRKLPLAHFVLGNRRTALNGDELLTHIEVPPRSPRALSTFMKLGSRRYLVISIAMVAAALDVDADGRVTRAGLCVGACSPAARRLPAAEQALMNELLEPGVETRLLAAHLAPLEAIDDVRAPASYRHEAALVLLRRAVAALAAQAVSRPAQGAG